MITNFKDPSTYTRFLPTLTPEQPLHPDHPIQYQPKILPINVIEVLAQVKQKSPPRRSFTPKGSQKHCVFNQHHIQQDQQSSRYGSQSRLQQQYRYLKQQYDNLMSKYKLGEQSFCTLKARCEYLQSQRQKSAQNTESFSRLNSLHNQNQALKQQLTTLQSHFALVKEQLVKIKALEDYKGKIASEAILLKKTIQLLTVQRDQLKQELYARQSNVTVKISHKQQNQTQLIDEMRSIISELKDQNGRLKTENLMFRSKEVQLQSYRYQIDKLTRQLQLQKQSSLNSSLQCQRLSKQLSQLKSVMEVSKQHSTVKKQAPSDLEQISVQQRMLAKHLDLSVREIQRISESSRTIKDQLIKKIEKLTFQKEQLQKKNQYQQFEVDKLFEVLQTRRKQLDACYRTIQNLRQVTPQTQSQVFAQLLQLRKKQIM